MSSQLVEIAKQITPLLVLKWASVVFVVALYALILISIVLALTGSR